MTWHAKPRDPYSPSSQDAIDNANESMLILMNEYGWTKAACCGLFGNIDHEGAWNPWRWQDDIILSRSQSQSEHGLSHGYGLIGWTPAGKYQFNNFTQDGTVLFPNYNQESYYGYGPNWSDVSGIPEDGAAQIRLIGEAMSRGSGNIWVTRKVCSASQFTQLRDPRVAAYYWLWNAEYPGNIHIQEPIRMQSAADWYARLGGNSAPPWIIFLKKAADISRGLLT